MSSLRLFAVSAIAVFAVACGSYGSSPDSPSPVSPLPGGPSVSILTGASTLGDRAYAPDDLTVTPGTTVTWTNNDSVAHTSTSDAPGWDSGIVNPGKQFSAAFPTAGTFTYHCAIHPGMTGTVIVR